MSSPSTQDVAPETTSTRSPAAAKLIVFLVVFIDLLGFGIVLPLLPRYAEAYLLVVPENLRGASLGILFSIFSLMQFVFSPMWGRVSDRIGRRPVILISLSGSVVFYSLFGFASDIAPEAAWTALALLFASRMGAGIAGASVSTAAAVIADTTPPETRAKGMALIGVAFGIGFTLGPLLGYFGLTVFDKARWAPGAMAALFSLASLLLAVWIMPETRRLSSHTPSRALFSLKRTMEVLNMPTVGSLVLIYFLAILAFANFEGTLSMFTGAVFHMDETDNFLIFAYVGFILMIAQGLFYRRLAGKLSEEKLLTIGVALMIFGLTGLGMVAWMAGPDASGLKTSFYCTVAAGVSGFAFVNPSVSALVSKRSDPGRQGEVLGVNQSFASLGRILGPLAGLVLFYAPGSHTLPYFGAVLILIVVVLLLPRINAGVSHLPSSAGGGYGDEGDSPETEKSPSPPTLKEP